MAELKSTTKQRVRSTTAIMDLPTTVPPTTVQPTTVPPTTVQPTMVQPTTVQPTTATPETTQTAVKITVECDVEDFTPTKRIDGNISTPPQLRSTLPLSITGQLEGSSAALNSAYGIRYE
eukprot:jgi/Psemu1/70633/estExt_Genemark1.C_29730005